MSDPTVRGASSVGVEEKRGRSKLWLILGLILLLIIAAAVAAIVIAAQDDDDAKKDVTIRTCEADPQGGKPRATGQILNNSSKTSNYVVRLKFTDAQGNTLSQGVAPVQSVDADRTARWELTGNNSARGPLRCELTGVSRTHIPGQ